MEGSTKKIELFQGYNEKTYQMTVVQEVYKTIVPNQNLKPKTSKMTISKKRMDFNQQIIFKTWKYLVI